MSEVGGLCETLLSAKGKSISQKVRHTVNVSNHDRKIVVSSNKEQKSNQMHNFFILACATLADINYCLLVIMEQQPLLVPLLSPGNAS